MCDILGSEDGLKTNYIKLARFQNWAGLLAAMSDNAGAAVVQFVRNK